MLVICLHVSQNGFLFSFTSAFCASFVFMFTTLTLQFFRILLPPIYFCLYLPLNFFFIPFDVTFFFFLYSYFLFSSCILHCIHSNLDSSSDMRNRGSVLGSCKELPSAQPAPGVQPFTWQLGGFMSPLGNFLGVPFSYARDNLIFYLVLHISTSLPFEK